MAFSAAERMYIADQSESAKITFFLDGQTENKRSQCVKKRQKSVIVYYVHGGGPRKLDNVLSYKSDSDD